MDMRPDTEYIAYDPFGGDRDIDIRCQSVKMVTTRKPQKCTGIDEMHDIQPGTRARYEKAIVEGKWGAYWMCVDCMDEWLDEWSG